MWVVWFWAAVAVVTHGAPLGKLPHIVAILGDDLGHYNVHWTDQNPEANSPNLDHLAENGLILRRHYVYKYCSPTRSALMSGRLPLHVNQNNPADQGGGIDLRMTLLPQKLKTVGYQTHHVGKWHLGETAFANLPINRGFDSSIGYLGGSEDHWTQRISQGVDLWQDHKPAWGQNGTYGAYIYTPTATDIIHSHDASKPLFMYAAFQNTHFPQEVPSSFLDPKIASARRTYHGMVSCLDESVGNLTAALKAKGMWDNTLLVFSADNGGASTIEGCHSNNYPLRGGKHTDFEGGVRGAAFVAGGVLPKKMQGKSLSEYIHVCDWYSTFCHLAGVKPDDPATGVPDIDSLNMWPLVSGETSKSPRTEIPLSAKADGVVAPDFSQGEGLIVGKWKLVTGNTNTGIWQGPQYPNTTKCPKMNDAGCPKGCLFDVLADPTELVDQSAAQPTVFKQLQARLAAIRATVFQTGWPGNHTVCKSMSDVVKENKGFVGPRCQ